MRLNRLTVAIHKTGPPALTGDAQTIKTLLEFRAGWNPCAHYSI
jgi:hypothetical protein